MLQGNVLLNVRMNHSPVLGEALFQAQAIMQNRPICRIYAMTLLRAIFCQTFALAITFIVTFWLPIFHHPIAFLLAQCGLAVSGSLLLRQPIWWIPIHLLFLPSVFIFFTISLPAWLYLVIVIALTLIFWGTEYAFHLIFTTDAMRYIGGVLGLTIGYYVKYQLDKRFVFIDRSEKAVAI